MPLEQHAVGLEPVHGLGHAREPRGPPHFAVGEDVHADVALACDGVANGRVLPRAKFRRVDAAAGMRGARRQQFRRTQKTPDLLGTERHRPHVGLTL